MTFDRDEVEAAFRKYWELGAAGEDWDAWCDAVLHRGRHLHRAHPRQQEGPRGGACVDQADHGGIRHDVHRVRVAHDRRRRPVVVYMQNRRDNPEPGAPPIDFPGMTVLEYAGDGKFSLEEDFWSLPEGIRDDEAVRRPRARSSIPITRRSARASTGTTGPSGRKARDIRGIAWCEAGLSRSNARSSQMQALAERIGEWLDGATFEGYAPLGFTGLKTYDPPPEALIGADLGARRRGAPSTSICISPATCASCSTCRKRDGSTSRNRPRRRSRRARSRVELLGRSCGAVARARDRTQGPLVGVGRRRRRTLPRPRTGSTSDEFAQWLREVDRRAADPHDPAGSTDGRRRRPRRRRRRVHPPSCRPMRR